MDFIEECMESIFTCFNRGKNNETAKGNPHHSLYYLDPLDLLDDGKLEKEFENLVEECGLSEERLADLKMYSREKKLTMLNTQSFRAEEDCGKLIDLLRTFDCETPELIAPPISTLQDIVTTLRTQRSSFIEQFVLLEGVRLLSTLLLRCQLTVGHEQQVLCLLGAFRALLNSKVVTTASSRVHCGSEEDLPSCNHFHIRTVQVPGIALYLAGFPDGDAALLPG
uniref:Drf_GBD domain-containing protein n=1 Tax=Angiostrongylus cantonensis TaxID=6313 RepID=A0A158P680_ANGCA